MIGQPCILISIFYPLYFVSSLIFSSYSFIHSLTFIIKDEFNAKSM